VILELQDQLRELEQKLGDLDESHYHPESAEQSIRIQSRTRDLEVAQFEQLDQPGAAEFDAHQDRPCSDSSVELTQKPVLSQRAMILESIQEKLVKYDEALYNTRRLNEFERPSKRDWHALRQWLENRRPLNFDSEEVFIDMKHDLITLNPRTDSGKIDAWIEDAISRLPEGMTSVSVL